MQPFFSIGVTTYDRIELLIETIGSIVAQTFSDFEVIVSNDNPERTITGELLGIQDSRIRFINQTENLGEFGNMNYLLNVSNGKYFTWIADDDLYSPHFLEEIYKKILKFNFPTCIFTSYDTIYDSNIPDMFHSGTTEGKLLTGRDFLCRYFKGKIKTIGVMGVFQTDYLTSLGGIEYVSQDNITIYSEYILILRAGLLKKVCYINYPLMFYRSHETAWGIRNTDVEIYKRAGQNLIPLSIEIFKNHALRDDFQQNLFYVLKLSMDYIVGTASKRPEKFSIRDLLTYFLSVKEHFTSLKKSNLYKAAILSWTKAGMYLIWSIAKETFKMKAPHSFKKAAYKILFFFKRQKTKPNYQI